MSCLTKVLCGYPECPVEEEATEAKAKAEEAPATGQFHFLVLPIAPACAESDASISNSP